VGKHAGASQVTLRLDFQPDMVSLTVEDDGRGFDVQDTPPDSFGLNIMQERAAKIGANFHIESEIGKGTQVMITWPVNGEKNE
jgi:two-component system sensor histidine kinase DegS